MTDTLIQRITEWREGVAKRQVRKTLWHYLADKIAWWRLPAERKKYYPGSAFNLLKPDWYRSETDAEFRTRILKETSESKVD